MNVLATGADGFIGSHLTDEQRIRPGKSEVFRLWCDNTKIHELTGFEPEYSIRDGLKATIEWFSPVRRTLPGIRPISTTFEADHV